LPEDHLAWFILDAVAEMDLDAFNAGFRTDGWGGAAHESSMRQRSTTILRPGS